MDNLSPTIPNDLAQTVASEVGADERIVLAIQPVPAKLAWKTIPIVLFGIPWTGFAILWVVLASSMTMGSKGGSTHEAFPFNVIGYLFPLFGLPFIAVGFSMLTSPYWIMRGARRTIYLVTDRRAIVFENKTWGGFNIRSFEPSELGDLRRNQNNDGSGDLVFKQEWRSGKRRRISTDVGFLAIPDVKEAEMRVRELVEKNSKKLQ